MGEADLPEGGLLDVSFAVVEVADPDIADARAVSDRQLFILVGKKIGATNVLLYGPSRQLIGVVDVEVKLDTRSIGSRIREGSGGKGIRVNDVYGKLVLSGNGGDSQTVERAMSVAAGLAPAGVVNALKVTTPQQVMLKVRFVEATRAAARSLGVRLEFFRPPEFALGSGSGAASGTSNPVSDAVSLMASRKCRKRRRSPSIHSGGAKLVWRRRAGPSHPRPRACCGGRSCGRACSRATRKWRSAL